MAQSQCRPCQPRPVEGDVGYRVLPHRRPRRPCRPLPGLRSHDDRLQQLPQPALPKCQGARRQGLARRARDRAAPGRPYFHIVFTLPAQIADIAYQNKAVIYDLLFKASAETMITIAADPKHLGAKIGITAVLHTWGSAMTHHPHVHMIVPGGGLSRRAASVGLAAGRTSSCPCWCSRGCSDGGSWRSSPQPTPPAGSPSSAPTHTWRMRTPSRPSWRRSTTRWFVYSKKPFAGPKAVLAYLSRYTHRVAISNRRLVAVDRLASRSRSQELRIEGPGRLHRR